MQTWQPRARGLIRVWGLSLLAGAIVGLGRPGLECVALQLVTTWVWLRWVIRQPDLLAAAVAGLGHGLALLATTCIGALGWGVHVVLAFIAYGTLLYSLPLALWAHRASRWLSPPVLLAATTAVFALIADASDWLYAAKAEALALVRVAPWWLSGARLVGANLLQGLLLASLVTSAAMPTPLGSLRAAARVGAPLAATALLLAGLGVVAHATAPPPSRSLRAGIVQLNIPDNYYVARMGSPLASRRLEQRLRAQVASLSDADLLVFTESFEERYSLLFPGVRQQLAKHSRTRHQALLMSSYLVDPHGDRTNALALFSQAGVLTGIHEKVDLTPFGEDEVSPGTEYRPLPFDQTVSIGALICNEAVLPNASRALVDQGANLLAVSTDDGSFGDSVVVFEHIANAQLRAIEVGRDTLWASNQGPSGRIDRFGAFAASTVLGAAQPSLVTLSAYGERTPFLRTRGLWIGLEALVLLAAWIRRGPTAVTGRRQERSARPWRALFAGVAAAVSTATLSPALVRARYGNAATAWAAIGDTFSPPPPVGEPGGYRRFTTGDGATLRGALAYLLSYYGPDIAANALPDPPTPQAPPDAIAKYLGRFFGVHSRRVQLANQPPTAAALVRRTNGKYAIVARSKGSAFFFFPDTGQSGVVPFTALRSHLEPWALVLAPDPPLVRAGARR